MRFVTLKSDVTTGQPAHQPLPAEHVTGHCLSLQPSFFTANLLPPAVVLPARQSLGIRCSSVAECKQRCFRQYLCSLHYLPMALPRSSSSEPSQGHIASCKELEQQLYLPARHASDCASSVAAACTKTRCAWRCSAADIAYKRRLWISWQEMTFLCTSAIWWARNTVETPRSRTIGRAEWRARWIDDASKSRWASLFKTQDNVRCVHVFEGRMLVFKTRGAFS